ncbi:MAG: family 43 glycosylhydrolase [Actinomycetaceae bacterium]|nr:family 43 glycosylhydrolase [Actinomycetaceae bacterium]
MSERACPESDITWGRGPEGQRRANLGDGTYRNPVMGGDYPDPTVLRVGERYYMTFSSFESSPGLILWRSENLVDWEPVGPACPQPWGSVFASDLIEYQGRFYLYIPFMPTSWSTVDAPTIAVMWTDDIEGQWNGPIDLGIRGYIDPGHGVGEDGSRWLFLNGVERIRLADDGLSTVGEIEHVYDGWQYPEDWVVESYALEGPKHLRRGDWHYLVSAVGGTAGPATGHMVIVARSRSIHGPWENMPTNPLVRCADSREPWWSRGHGTIVEGPSSSDGQESWYIIYHAYERGHQELGRQICLEPIEWTEDGWPVARGGDLSEALPLPGIHEGGAPGDNAADGAPNTSGFALSDDFSAPSWGWRWTFDQPAADEAARATFTEAGLKLAGKGADPSASSPMVVKAPDRSYVIEADMERCDEAVSAGMLLWFNHRLFIGLELADDGLITWAGGARTWGREPARTGVRRLGVRIEKREHIVTMWYRFDEGEWTQHSVRFETSGYHANTVADLVSLRPALFAAGQGAALFHSFTYAAL